MTENRFRILRRAGWVCAVALAGWLLVALLHKLAATWVAHPPPAPANVDLTREIPRHEQGRTVLGRNWREVREGLPVLHLAGSAFEMGYANGVLMQEQIHRQEETMLNLLYRRVPHAWTRTILIYFVLFRNRDLHDHIRPEYQMEMLGISKGCPDVNPQEGPYFHRLLNYHAAQDISYMLMNSPLIRGCTAFCAWGAATADGHMLVGRNFDWEADPIFDEERLVVLCEPDDGIPFASLAWAGMVGSVSGMNREGISITVNGAPSRLPRTVGTPTCLVARHVLQHARTIDDAVKIIREHRVFVSALFLVGSRRDRRSVVVEKTPERTAVREAGTNSFEVCANHFMTPDLAADPLNRAFLESDTSQSRYDRLVELLNGSSARVDPRRAADMLRDKDLPGGRFEGNGHRGALNPLIATHSVVMDLTEGIFWAASPPHQLGPFVAFDVNDPERRLPERTLPADALLSSGAYEKYKWSANWLAQGRAALRAGHREEAVDCADRAEALNPGFYANEWLRGEALLAMGNRAAALAALDAAAKRQPAMGRERRLISDLHRKASR